MFATIRVYQNATSKQEIAQRVEQEFIPVLKETPGFRGWYIIDGGNGALASVTLFDSLEDTMAANEKSAQWIRDNDAAELLPEAPEVIAGEVMRSVML
jgi:hypothetical protein